ncbi:YitT family protein [Amedibacillus dolichus]|uniref:YitT family protein n=1 Tax=Amedibacillus dolichus TaxID=31971 RepID=UPI0039A0ED3D
MDKKIKDLQKIKSIRFIISIIMIIASSLLQVYVINVFMNPCNLLSSGFTGVAILLNKISNLFGFNFSTSLGILALNIPAALLAYKSVSHRFTLLSCIQFILTSVFLQFLDFSPLFDDLTLNVLFGGFLYGMSVVLALRANGSTGGTDFIALYVSNKIHKSIWDYVFIFNCSMLIIFGYLFGWEHAGYSIIFQLISTRTISNFYQRYEQITIEITTNDPEVITEAFMNNFHHGMSVITAYGGYSKKRFYLCKTVVSSYEVRDVVDCIRSVKPDALINTYSTLNFYGKFYQKPIE